MQVRYIIYSFLIGLFPAALPFASAQFHGHVIEIERDVNSISMMDYTKSIHPVKGIGTANPAFGGSIANRLVYAMTEARKNAFTRMAIAIGNLRVDGQTTIYRETLVSTRFKLQIDELVQYAREIDHKQHVEKDGSVLYESIVAIAMNGEQGLNRYLIPHLQEKDRQNPLPRYQSPHDFTPPAEARVFNPETKYTGLIIKTGSLDIRPAIAPRIFSDEGRVVYSPSTVAADYAIEHGVAGYARTATPAEFVKERVGNNPLVIEAVDVSGVNKADLIISSQSAGRVLYADQIAGFLNECRVLFMLP